MSGLLSVAGRVVLITGAAQGIGLVLARAFAEAGAAVVLADRAVEAAEAAAAAIRDGGGQASAVAVDVADPQSVDEMVRQSIARHGRIDVLINNAALFSTLKVGPFEEITPEVWDTVMRVNVTGPFLCSRAVAPVMRAQGFGRIVMISSGAVTMGRPNYLHYTTSKAGLIGMARSLARELGPDGITVNSVLPGAVDTGIPRETVTPASKAAIVARQCIARGQVPEDLVGVMLFLASDGSAFLTGQSITVDGGATHL